MRSIPPFTGDQELDAWNQEVAQYLTGLPVTPVYNQGTGIITNPVDESIVGFLERYLHVRYADDRIGTNFSNDPSGRLFYGVHNDAASAESTDPVDYTWFEVEGGFGASNKLWFRNLGGRACDLYVGSVAPNYRWNLVNADAIDLDDLIGTGVIGEDELADGSITNPKLAAGAVTVDKMNTTGVADETTVLYGDFVWRVPAGGGSSGLSLPQVLIDGSRDIAELDTGRHLYHPTSHDLGVILTIPPHASLPLDIGSTLLIINRVNNLAIRIDGGDIYELLTSTSSPAWLMAPDGQAES